MTHPFNPQEYADYLVERIGTGHDSHIPRECCFHPHTLKAALLEGMEKAYEEGRKLPVQIPLYPFERGLFTTVDASDYATAMTQKWFVYDKGPRSQTTYAGRMVRDNGKIHNVALHRVILQTPEGMEVDHLDGNGLNNTRANIRNVTRSMNAANTYRYRSTGVRGFRVYTTKAGKKRYEAKIIVKGKYYPLGIYDTAEEAQAAYEDAIINKYGSALPSLARPPARGKEEST